MELNKIKNTSESNAALLFENGGQEPVLVGNQSPCLDAKWAAFAHLYSPDDIIFGCADDWNHLVYFPNSLSTKFLDFTVVLAYNNITVFGTCLHLLHNGVIYHFTSLTSFLLHLPLYQVTNHIAMFYKTIITVASV